MSNIKISVIMPSLNVSKYIRECMESVTRQTLSDIEIICVDAGSTDGTLEVLMEYAKRDSRIKIINSDKKSYGYQVNLGIGCAGGEYIGIVETDDYIDADMYEKLYSFTDNDVDYVKCGYKEVVTFHSSNISYDVNRQNLQNLFGKKLKLSENRDFGMLDLNHIWSAIYRRDFLVKEQIKLNETPGASYQDTSFSLLVGLLANTCTYIEDSLYNYRVDNENSSVKTNSKIACVMEEYRYIVNQLSIRNLDNEENMLWVLKRKLITYKWNMLRLLPEQRRYFRGLIKEELDIYDSNELQAHLENEYKQALNMLRDEKYILEYENEKRKSKELIQEIHQYIMHGSRCVVVGAGALGNRVILLPVFWEIEFIDAICDNNKLLQQKVFNQYKVQSVEAAVKLYRNDLFIVANKCHGQEIKKQLVDLGIKEDNIFCLGNVPPFCDLSKA